MTTVESKLDALFATNLPATQAIVSAQHNSKAVSEAMMVIGEYAVLIDGAFADASGIRNRALHATYAAVVALRKDPDQLEEYLRDGGKGREAGRVSDNPVHPIVSKLWRKVPTKESLSRYSAMLAYAESSQVKPKDFPDWLKTVPGGIGGAADAYRKMKKSEKTTSEREQEEMEKRNEVLSEYGEPIPLPEEVGQRQAGLYLSLIRVMPEGHASLLTTYDLTQQQVHAFIKRQTVRK